MQFIMQKLDKRRRHSIHALGYTKDAIKNIKYMEVEDGDREKATAIKDLLYMKRGNYMIFHDDNNDDTSAINMINDLCCN